MPSITIPRQARGTTGTKRQNQDNKRAISQIRSAGKAWRAEERKRRSYRDAGSVSVPTARLIIETLPTSQKPSVVSVFGQLGVGETATMPAHRLSPRQGRRLRRRGVQVVQQAVNVLKAEQARLAKAARDEESRQLKLGVKTRCNARTKLGLQCRKSAVADGYCATHG